MSLYAFIFYLTGGLIVASTAIAITRRHMVHAVIYLLFSFFGTAVLFYLLGAPLLAALWVIIYAGAIMVLFLFIVMMIRTDTTSEVMFPLSQWLPAAIFGAIYLAVGVAVVLMTPGTEVALPMVVGSPREFALYVFQNHWLSIEIVSLLLLVALVGAVSLGRGRGEEQTEDEA